MIGKVGIFTHPNAEAATDLAATLTALLTGRGCQVWSASAWDRAAAVRHMAGTDLLICVGGDGTVLRGARAAIPHPVRILAVNMGRLGFLAELSPEEAPEAALAVLDGAGLAGDGDEAAVERQPDMLGDGEVADVEFL
jgi:NAD+ kinase